MRKHHKIIKRIILLAIIILLTVCITRFVFKLNEMNSVYYEREFNATFQVGGFAGFAVDIDVINFGVVTTGGSSTKELTVYHEYSEPLKVKVKYSGNIAKTISTVPSFYLEPKTEKKINLIAHAGNELANYTGKIKIMLIKP